MKNYINPFINYIKLYRDKVIGIHKFMKFTKEHELHKYYEIGQRNLYLVCINWLLETLVYGFLITIAMISFTDVRWYYPVSMGILSWLVVDIIGRITNKIRSK